MNIFIGDNIKKFRKSIGITQEEFASYIGVTFQAVSKWERNESYPDIELLPIIANYFHTSVDYLLQNNNKNDETEFLISLYDNMVLSERSSIFEKYKSAINSYPSNYALQVRYMDLLKQEKYSVYDDNFENTHIEIIRIYNNIQNNCNDDSIRIWAKRILIETYMYSYQCCGFDEKHKNEAYKILETMPSLKDSKEYLASINADATNWLEVHEYTINELIYLLQNMVISYCYYTESFSKEYKIKAIIVMNSLIETFCSKQNSQNNIHRIYNIGHLGHLYYEIGNEDASIKYLKLALEEAKTFDNNPNSKNLYKYFEHEKRFHNMNMQERIKELILHHYPLSDKIRGAIF